MPYTLLTEDVAALQPAPLAVVMLITVGIVHTGIAYLLYFSGMTGAGAVASSLLSYIDPLTAVILSALILKEHTSLLGWLGALLILGSTAAVEIAEMKKK
ncbi:MAG: DMT family transporter [Clostridia bacterium]|nr:DMT family transporter [Clostridia bacterium]